MRYLRKNKYLGLPKEQVEAICSELSVITDRLDELAILFSKRYHSETRLEPNTTRAKNELKKVIERLKAEPESDYYTKANKIE